MQCSSDINHRSIVCLFFVKVLNDPMDDFSSLGLKISAGMRISFHFVSTVINYLMRYVNLFLPEVCIRPDMRTGSAVNFCGHDSEEMCYIIVIKT